MTRIQWGKSGERYFEAGCDRGVLYPKLVSGVPWNGLISVEEAVSGGEIESYYWDGNKYLDIVANEDFQAVLTAMSAPREFDACDGVKSLGVGLFATQQPRLGFGLSYRTQVGNDTKGFGAGYKLHLVYNAVASPSGRVNSTLGDNVEPTNLTWTINTVPPPSSVFKPTAHFVIDSRIASSADMTELENLLYGTVSTNPVLPTQAAVIAIFS